MWVSTNVTGINYTEAGQEGFNRLFQYIQGANEQQVKIPMSSPVLTEIAPGAGPNCESGFIVSFFMDFEFQKSPPVPTASDVYIRYTPEMQIITQTFGGFADKFDSKVIENLQDAFKWASDNNYDVSQTTYTIAQYDSPFTILNRHNEVWLYVE